MCPTCIIFPLFLFIFAQFPEHNSILYYHGNHTVVFLLIIENAMLLFVYLLDNISLHSQPSTSLGKVSTGQVDI